MLRSIFGTERPVQMKSLWPLAWACLQAILADSGTTWFSSARVPSISMNTSLLLVVMVTFVTGWTSPSQLTLTAPPEGAKKIPPKNLQASHGVGGPAAVGVLDFDGHTEQFRQAFVGQAILQRTGVDDGASTGITH